VEIATEAFEHGIKHGDTTGRLNKYISYLYLQERKANNIRIYHQKVFLFHDSVLITILNLPQQFNNSIEAIKRKQRLEEYNKENRQIKSKK
jgi:hypothetical protein